MSGIRLPAALDRLFSTLGAWLDRGEAWLHRAFGAETRTDRLLIGMAFNFALVMAVVLPVDLLFRHFTEGENSLLPLQQFVTWTVYTIEHALGVDVAICGTNDTQLCYAEMIDLEIISSCSGLHETIFLTLLVLCFRGVRPEIRLKWAGILAAFIFFENIFRIIMAYPMNQHYGFHTWDRFHYFWWQTGQYALIMALFILWVMIVAGNPKNRSPRSAILSGEPAGAEPAGDGEAEAGGAANDAMRDAPPTEPVADTERDEPAAGDASARADGDPAPRDDD